MQKIKLKVSFKHNQSNTKPHMNKIKKKQRLKSYTLPGVYHMYNKTWSVDKFDTKYINHFIKKHLFVTQNDFRKSEVKLTLIRNGELRVQCQLADGTKYWQIDSAPLHINTDISNRSSEILKGLLILKKFAAME